MAAEKDDKTEDPTAKRKGETRRKGQVAKSTDLNSGFMLLVAIVSLYFLGGNLYVSLKDMLIFHLSHFSEFEFSSNNLILFLTDTANQMFWWMLPFLLLFLIFGILINLVQVGFLFTLQPLQPKFGKIFKLEGLAKFKTLQPIIELIKGIFKMGIIGYVAYLVVKDYYDEMLLLLDQNILAMWDFVLMIGFELSIKIALLLLFIGLLDFIYQKFKFKKEQKMSKQEVKDENKMQEGDQAIKQKMKQMGFEMVRKSMMTEVPKATVVVTNPTFIALAIQYEREAGQTPKIVAKGKRLIAENIKKIAEENSVPIVENKPLARGMYDLVEVGDEIPETFFNAVAEVLAYVYKMDNRNS